MVAAVLGRGVLEAAAEAARPGLRDVGQRKVDQVDVLVAGVNGFDLDAGFEQCRHSGSGRRSLRSGHCQRAHFSLLDERLCVENVVDGKADFA